MEQVSSDEKRRKLNTIFDNILNKIHINDLYIVLYQIVISPSTSDTVSSYFISKIQHYFVKYSIENKAADNLFISGHKYDLLNIIFPLYNYYRNINKYSYKEIDNYYERINSCLAYYRAILKFSKV